ncbi:MAG: acyl-CoA carboxylase subunit epsilon [Microbacteriaceae bacterium]
MTEPDDTTPTIRVVGGSPTAEELAAVTAVLTSVLDELAAEHVRHASSGPSAWQVSQRPIRAALTPGMGAWRSFNG